MAQAFVKIGNKVVNQYQIEEVQVMKAANKVVLTLQYKSGKRSRIILPSIQYTVRDIANMLNGITSTSTFKWGDEAQDWR